VGEPAETVVCPRCDRGVGRACVEGLYPPVYCERRIQLAKDIATIRAEAERQDASADSLPDYAARVLTELANRMARGET